ncbi:MAG: sugar phosphate isomerase/epimerase, partial [Chloroflexota bacterium]|nr:sugar phosphate isomerase/epimerase [Chloroflexota bacterium]
MQSDQISIQLYTVRDAAKEDFLGTLSRIAEIGYPNVEFAGLHGHNAGEIRAHMDSVGLKAPSAHVAYARFVDEFDTVIAEMQTLGCEYAIVPWIDPETRAGLANARRFVTSLQEIGEKVNAAGLQFGYHNHDFEFAPLAGGNGETMWDLLLNETDPAVVKLELDIYWVAYGGADPAALVSENPERYPLLHFKDMQGTGESRRDAPVGQGTMDFAPLAATSAATTKYYVVEQDNP